MSDSEYHSASDDDLEGEQEDRDEVPSTSDAVDLVRDRGVNEHGCDHYRRRCKLVAPCCGEVFWCRHCHNAAKDDQEQDPAKRHTLDRKAVRELVCALCNTRQPVASGCVACGTSFGRYFCADCNFFDDDVSKQQFHCNACGICRVGGRPNFFHCATCNCCYALSLQQSHVCVANSMHQNCPVCFEYLFDSVRPIAVLPCGHTIHQECYHNLLSHDSVLCPICLKCAVSEQHRERMWARLDEAVESTPMPPEYRLQVQVLCNDCSAKTTVQFHVIGHKCGSCGGYNTRRI